MKKLTVSLLALTVLTGGAFAQLSVGFNAGFTGDMYGLSSDFYDQNKGYLTDELAPPTGITEVKYEPNTATVGFDFGLNATYDMGFFFVRADFRRETLISGGENTFEQTGMLMYGNTGDTGAYTVKQAQTTAGAITSIPVYFGVNIPVMKGKIFAGMGYGYYMADATLTLDLSGTYIDAMDAYMTAVDASLGAAGLGLSSTSLDRKGELSYSTTGTGVEYLLGYQSKISDNLSLAFTYSAGGGVVYGESEFDTYAIDPVEAGGVTYFPGVNTADYSLAEGFDQLSSQFLYAEVSGGKTKTMFPLKTAGSKI
ncbi:MAG: hypothetical protein COY19_04010, partial [Candidatus Marinimicrobia bacterium CG_4_10_14_0_2_um_filter_48_9]